MDELKTLAALAEAMGVRTDYYDGLGRYVEAPPETLVRVCAALGAEIEEPGQAGEALGAFHARKAGEKVPPVLVAWEGRFPGHTVQGAEVRHAEIYLEEDGEVPVQVVNNWLHLNHPLPLGYHRMVVDTSAGRFECRIISAPFHSWRRPGEHRSWGVGTQLAALRSERSRSLGDLADLERVCRWVKEKGGDLVTALPLLPTFNAEPPEPSPYSPVSRLFWSELILDLGEHHRPVGPVNTLDVVRADAEVRAALAGIPSPPEAELPPDLVHYARFRGAQARLGRNWRDWPESARDGDPLPDHVDPEEERFHRVAQLRVREQLHAFRERMEGEGIRLGLDLAVGVHPDGYDPWSRQWLFAQNMSVGAPPDGGFPSGQDWGFAPVLPEASRREGHHYMAHSIAHQAALAGVLRVDHIMALNRLYWIPHGMDLDQGTYVEYPQEELFAVLILESHRNRCEVVGENLGTVPLEIYEALPRHRIWGMYLAQFEGAALTASEDMYRKAETAKAQGDDWGEGEWTQRGVWVPEGDGGNGGDGPPADPAAGRLEPVAVSPADWEVALIGTHDTPTFRGWLEDADIDERLRVKLLREEAEPEERRVRDRSIALLAQALGQDRNDARAFLEKILDWMGRSHSPLVIPWIEDLWLERDQVNVPGTSSAQRPNWQRPMSRTLDDVLSDPDVHALAEILDRARKE